MEILSFELCGKMAHFRKPYANATALSYTLPPRTTILGIIAAILELPRDSYYGDVPEKSIDDLLIGVRINNPIRKVIQKLNYLKIGDSNGKIAFTDSALKGRTDNWNDRLAQFMKFSGEEHHSQVPTELLFPDNLIKDNLSFQIYIGSIKRNNNHFEKLKERLEMELYPFGICLGSANFLGFINQGQGYLFNGVPFETNGKVKIHTAILTDLITEFLPEKNIEIEQDNFPLRFQLTSVGKSERPTRIAKEVKSMIYSVKGGLNHYMSVVLSDYSNVFHIPKLNQNIFLL